MNRRLQGRREFEEIPPSLIEFLFKRQGRRMKREFTLKKNHEFRRMYQKGASAVSGQMVIYCRKNRLDHNRLGITASVKLGHAVVRNRARRRLREVYRLNADKLSGGWDIVLVARGRTTTASWQELNDAFLRLCRKLELLKEEK